MNISELDLPVRVEKALHKSFKKIKTVQDLYDYQDKGNVLNIKGIGKNAFEKINKALKDRGYSELEVRK